MGRYGSFLFSFGCCFLIIFVFFTGQVHFLFFNYVDGVFSGPLGLRRCASFCFGYEGEYSPRVTRAHLHLIMYYARSGRWSLIILFLYFTNHIIFIFFFSFLQDRHIFSFLKQTMNKRQRAFCVTHNNYPEDWRVLWETVETEYACFGEEKAPTTGTPHLQGYIRFKNATTMRALQRKLVKKGIQCKLLVAKGNAEQNRRYCSKDGSFFEWGKITEQGKRNDLTAMLASVSEGMGKAELAETHGGTWARYYKAAEEYRHALKAREAEAEAAKEMANVELRDWQKEAIDKLFDQSNRQVLWIVDEKGNKGTLFLHRSDG